MQKGLRWSDRHHKKKQLDMEDRGFLAARSNRRHIVQIQRLGWGKKLHEKSEAAVRTPISRALK